MAEIDLGKIQPLFKGVFTSLPVAACEKTDQLIYNDILYVAIADSDGTIAPINTSYFNPISGGLGTAAQLDTGTASDQIATNGEMGNVYSYDAIADWNNITFSTLITGQKLYFDTGTINVPTQITDIRSSGELTVFKTTLDNYGGYTLKFRDGTIAIISVANGVVDASYKAYTESNTTVDGSGFIKEASPIVKLYDDTIEVESLSKFGGTPEITKVSTGVYQITGTQGLRLGAGWYIETPNDRNGNKYFNIDWSQNIEPENTNGVVSEFTDGVVVTIETFERVWNSETGLFENGNPVDICENQTRAVSLRFNEIVQVEEE